MNGDGRGAVVVTGASSGIGQAAAELLAREGFVAFAGVRTDADAARIGALHANIRPLRLDVTDRASIDAAVGEVAAGGLPLRGVVNNAGVAVAGPLEFLPVDELRRQFEINVFGALEVSQAFMPQLRVSRGRLIFVGSISGRLAIPFIAPYSASKFALRALTDALRVELAPAGIVVALLEPSSVRTPIWQKGRDSREALLGQLPAKAMEYYGPQIDAVFAATQEEERIAIPVERVSAAILHALTARKPRRRYLLGQGARVGSIVALLPSPIRDRALRASMKLP
jgi:NAD(P)-dependent dehydrogenase (short-subunit alcohol dehydrogenase family)